MLTALFIYPYTRCGQKQIRWCGKQFIVLSARIEDNVGSVLIGLSKSPKNFIDSLFIKKIRALICRVHRNAREIRGVFPLFGGSRLLYLLRC